MTAYQAFLLGILVLWPLVIIGILFLMGRLEDFVKKIDAQTPEEAGLEPVKGETSDREVRIVFGDQVVRGPEEHGEDASRPAATP